MLSAAIRFSLKNRVLVLAGALMLMGYGAYTAVGLPVDVFPDLNRPTVTVMTEAGGLSPEEVELGVTRPIETAMNGAPGVDRVRSSSGIGLSIVWVEFAWGTDVWLNRQQIGERLRAIENELPPGVEPELAPVSSIMGEIMLVGMTSEGGVTEPSELRALADFDVRRRLLAVRGVAQVMVLGGGLRQLRVRVDPMKLAQFGVSFEEVAVATGLAQANTTGGFLDRQNQEYLVRNIARTTDVARIAETVIASRNGVAVTLGMVAELSLGPGVKRGDAGVNGQPAVVMSIQKQPGASTIDLTHAVDEALAELDASLPADVTLTTLFRQSSFIEASTENVVEALRDGAFLVVIVLFLFLQSLRTTFITLTAIPLSLAMTFIVFDAFDLSVNTMTLGGIAVAIGELVDDAIVDVENVFRRIRENRAHGSPVPMLRVIWEASNEVRGSIVFATMIVVLVFVPLFALSGIEGRLFAPLGVAYIVSILSSLVVSVTVTPALCSVLLPRAKATAHSQDGLLVRALKRLQRRVLALTLSHPATTLGGAAVLVVVAIGAVPFFGREFLPPFNEGTATINLLAAPGTSLSTSNTLGQAAEKMLLAIPEVRSVGRRTGRAEQDEHAEGVHYTEVDVDFRTDEEMAEHELGEPRARAAVLADMRSRLSSLPGVVVNIGQPISHRLDHLLSGVRAQIAIKLFGKDLGDLREYAERIEAAARTVPGMVDLQTEKQVLVPQVRIRVRAEEVARYGFQPGALAESLEAALDGEVVGQLISADRSIGLWVRVDDAARADVGPIADTLLLTPSGARVAIRELAEVSVDRGPNMIQHDDGQRRIVVFGNVEGTDLGSAVSELKAKIGAIALPPGMRVAFEGQFQSQESASRLIALLSLLSLAGMVLVLYVHFRSLVLVMQVLVNIPLALIGSVAALAIAGLPMSVATLVGFITLCGIASRNTIMMIDHYIHLMRYEGHAFSRELVVQGSLERLVPVLMTALTAGLGLIPLVMSSDAPGKEILYPVAVVILGGLISSTLLDLLVTPAAFWLFGERSSAARTTNDSDPLAPASSPPARLVPGPPHQGLDHA